MTTLQPGTKVKLGFIHGTIVKADDTTAEMAINDYVTITAKVSDLTVCETAQPISEPQPTPSFKAGQEATWTDEDIKRVQQAILCNHKDAVMNENFALEFLRPIPAQPTGESELKEILWTGAGHASMCWEPRPSGVFDEKEANVAAKNMYDQVMAWHQKHSNKVEVSVLVDEIMREIFENEKHDCLNETVTVTMPFVRGCIEKVMTRKEQQG